MDNIPFGAIVLTDFPFTVPIAPSASTGLKVSSVVRFDKIATLEKRIVAGRLGNADPAWLHQCRVVFFGVFGFGKLTE